MANYQPSPSIFQKKEMPSTNPFNWPNKGKTQLILSLHESVEKKAKTAKKRKKMLDNLANS